MTWILGKQEECFRKFFEKFGIVALGVFGRRLLRNTHRTTLAFLVRPCGYEKSFFVRNVVKKRGKCVEVNWTSNVAIVKIMYRRIKHSEGIQRNEVLGLNLQTP